MIIVTGYAENERGFKRGPLTVEPGTTVGVYWRVWRRSHSSHVMVSPARIIGTLDPDRPWPPRHRWPRWMDWHARMRLIDLKLFLRGWYDAYLTMVDEDATSWDETRQLFVVGGYDQDDQPADAAIDRKGVVAITPRDTDRQARPGSVHHRGRRLFGQGAGRLDPGRERHQHRDRRRAGGDGPVPLQLRRHPRQRTTSSSATS